MPACSKPGAGNNSCSSVKPPSTDTSSGRKQSNSSNANNAMTRKQSHATSSGSGQPTGRKTSAVGNDKPASRKSSVPKATPAKVVKRRDAARGSALTRGLEAPSGGFLVRSGRNRRAPVRFGFENATGSGKKAGKAGKGRAKSGKKGKGKDAGKDKK